jgi:F0F1-type ATP synthase delta subunit
MIRKMFAQGKIRIPENQIGESWMVYHSLNNLVAEIFGAEKITDELFKRIGEVLVRKVWFWKAVEIALDEEILSGIY